MKMAKVLESLIKEKYSSTAAFAAENDIPTSTLYSIFKRGCSNASVSVVMKICHCLGLTIDDLISMADDNTFQPAQEQNTLTPEYVKLLDSIKNLSVSDIEALAKLLKSAKSEDIELISSILLAVNKNKRTKDKN